MKSITCSCGQVIDISNAPPAGKVTCPNCKREMPAHLRLDFGRMRYLLVGSGLALVLLAIGFITGRSTAPSSNDQVKGLQDENKRLQDEVKRLQADNARLQETAKGPQRTPPEPPLTEPPERISKLPGPYVPWDKAAEHKRDTVTVEGPVVRATYRANTKGSPTFIDLGKAYPDQSRLTILIWGANRAKFPSPPEDCYRDKTVHVRGMITEHDGVLEIDVDDPANIEIVQK